MTLPSLRLPLLLAPLLLITCSSPRPSSAPSHTAALVPLTNTQIIADFEQPNPPATWVPQSPASQPATEPSTQPATLQRSALRPHAGLWALAAANITANGAILFTPPHPLDLSRFNLFTAQITHANPPAQNGEFTASLALTDADGKTIESDAFPVLSTWQPIPFDLRSAYDQGLDTSRITAIAINLHAGEGHEPITIQTDTWSAQSLSHIYTGDRLKGAPKSFFVESQGTHLSIGSVGQYEILLSDRGASTEPPPAVATAPSENTPLQNSAPWLQIFLPPPPAKSNQPPRKVLGQFGTGLFLLDQSALDALKPFRRQSPDAPSSSAVPSSTPLPQSWSLPTVSWPASLAPNLSRIQWQVAWTSPIAALVQGTQESGPYDRLGEPAVTIKWQLMIYQWGQVFVHVQWTKSGELAPPPPNPVSWALVLDDRLENDSSTGTQFTESNDAQERLLSSIYPATFRDGLVTALPHQMQSAGPIAMIARTTPQKDTWWWAAAALTPSLQSHRHFFGAGLAPAENANPTQGQADCMLLVNDPNPLTKAASFGQYLVPPKIILRQGELDRNFPGDSDNDGFVESLGFQVIRLANGRATFSIYPQERPIFYPACLFTIPAAERDALDLKHSRLLINIDGKQFNSPPQFPDGSFLLQIPYVLDRPVSVEAILVKQ